MNVATAIDAIAVALVAASVGVLWLAFLRSLALRRHPLYWAAFLVIWTAGLAGWLAFIHLLDVSSRQRIVLVLQLAYPSWFLVWQISRMLRRPWVPADPYSWSRSEKRALFLAAGVVLSGFLLVAGFITFAALRGSTSSLTVENDTESFVQVMVANGCRRDSSICENRPVGIYFMGLAPRQIGHARRARGHVGPEQVLGFVSGAGAQRCLVSLDGGDHALASQAPSCPMHAGERLRPSR